MACGHAYVPQQLRYIDEPAHLGHVGECVTDVGALVLRWGSLGVDMLHSLERGSLLLVKNVDALLLVIACLASHNLKVILFYFGGYSRLLGYSNCARP